MDNEFDLDELIESPQKRTGSKKLKSNLVRQGTNSRDVNKAKGRQAYGEDQETRKTIYLPAALIDEIDAAAREQNFKLMKFYRVLVEAGWQFYLDGAITVEFEEEVTIKKGLTWQLNS